MRVWHQNGVFYWRRGDGHGSTIGGDNGDGSRKIVVFSECAMLASLCQAVTRSGWSRDTRWEYRGKSNRHFLAAAAAATCS